MDEQANRPPSPKVLSSTSSFTVMVCFPVSISVITALMLRSVSSFNEPHPDRDGKRVNKHRAIPISVIFLCSNGVPQLVVIAEYLFYPLFRNQSSAFLCSVLGLFCMLKNKINDVFSAALIHLKRKCCKGCAVSVMAAFVGYVGNLQSIRKRNCFVNRKCVKISPERYFMCSRRSEVLCINPCASINDFNGCMLVQKINQVRLRLGLVVESFRMPMQRMAQSNRQFIVFRIHSTSHPQQWNFPMKNSGNGLRESIAGEIVHWRLTPRYSSWTLAFSASSWPVPSSVMFPVLST